MSASTAAPAAVDTEDLADLAGLTAIEAARVSGVASNAFRVRDSQGIVLLSLPPEQSFSSMNKFVSTAKRNTELAEYCLVIGKRSKKKGIRTIFFLACKHYCLTDSRSNIGLYIPLFPTVLHSVVAHESMQVTLLFSTFSSKNDCNVRLKVNKRLDGQYELRW